MLDFIFLITVLYSSQTTLSRKCLHSANILGVHSPELSLKQLHRIC